MDTKTEKNVTEYLDKLHDEADKESKETGDQFGEYITEYEKGFKDKVISKYEIVEEKTNG